MAPFIVLLWYESGLPVEETSYQPAAFMPTTMQPAMSNMPDGSVCVFPHKSTSWSHLPPRATQSQGHMWLLFLERYKQTFTIYGSVGRIYLSRQSDIQRWSNWHFSWAIELGPAQRQANSFSKGHGVGCWWFAVERYFRFGQGHNQRGL